MNVTHVKRLRNLQHPATPHIRLTHVGRVARHTPGKGPAGSLGGEPQPSLDPVSLEQLDEWEQAAALAEAAAGEDETAWGLCGPEEDEGHEYSDFGPADQGSDSDELGNPGPWPDEPSQVRDRPDPMQTASQERQLDWGAEILDELRELHRDGQQVVWPPG